MRRVHGGMKGEIVIAYPDGEQAGVIAALNVPTVGGNQCGLLRARVHDASGEAINLGGGLKTPDIFGRGNGVMGAPQAGPLEHAADQARSEVSGEAIGHAGAIQVVAGGAGVVIDIQRREALGDPVRSFHVEGDAMLAGQHPERGRGDMVERGETAGGFQGLRVTERARHPEGKALRGQAGALQARPQGREWEERSKQIEDNGGTSERGHIYKMPRPKIPSRVGTRVRAAMSWTVRFDPRLNRGWVRR